MAKELLTLDTLTRERDFIKVDGAKFELLAPDDFSLVDQASLMRIGRRLTRMSDTDVEEREAQITADQLKAFVRKIVRDLPEAVNAKLTDAQRLAIIEVFMGAMPGRKAQESQASQSQQQTTPARLNEADGQRMAEYLNRNPQILVS